MVHEAVKSVLKILKPTEKYYSAVFTERKLEKVTEPLSFNKNVDILKYGGTVK